MSEIINIYCDESCHLENDRQLAMVMGAVACPAAQVKQIHADILGIIKQHHAFGEIKWTKVSVPRLDFHRALVDYFFDNPSLRFRAWVVTHKAYLNHDYFNQGSHDSFYYKMYYYMLLPLVRPPHTYHIYLDVKDTRSAKKVKELGQVLCNANHDFLRDLVPRIQSVVSDEIPLMQLADLLIGAVSYRNRPAMVKLGGAKHQLMNHIATRYGADLVGNTPPWKEKFNFYTFTPQGAPR